MATYGSVPPGGLSSFDPRSHSFSNYSTADGLPGNDFTGFSACYKSRRGELFLRGIFGRGCVFPGRCSRAAKHSARGPHFPRSVRRECTYRSERAAPSIDDVYQATHTSP